MTKSQQESQQIVERLQGATTATLRTNGKYIQILGERGEQLMPIALDDVQYECLVNAHITPDIPRNPYLVIERLKDCGIIDRE